MRHDFIDTQISMVLIEMNKLYVMFCMPIMLLPNGEVLYRWINKRAHDLYSDYSELLQLLQNQRKLN